MTTNMIMMTKSTFEPMADKTRGNYESLETDDPTEKMDFPTVVEEVIKKTSDTPIIGLGLARGKGEEDIHEVSEMKSENNELSLSGSFCTEVRSMHLTTVKNADKMGSDDPGATPLIDIESASDDTDHADSDDDGLPTKTQDSTRRKSSSSSSYLTELKNARRRFSIGKGALTATAELTPDEVAKRIESFQESKNTDVNGCVHLTPLARFRRAATQVKMLCAVQISLDKHIREAGRSAFGGGLPDLVANMANTPSVVFTSENQERIAFNPTEFKCKYEFTWPKKARHAVEKPPEDRTKDDIRLIAGLMRGLHSFRKYTKVVQDLICRVVRLQKYGRRRVVVRKGHIGYSFYFIFSGAACATLDEDEETAFMKKEVTVLKKGASFGEIALLKDVRRKATVVCLQDTELLVVDRDDFFDNGLDRHIHQEFEYRLNFFQNLELFSTWSEECVEEVSDMGRIEEYNHDSVIVKDSTENEWLLFIIKGRCDVLKFVDLAKLCMAEDEDDVGVKNGRRSTRGTSRSNRERHLTQSSILTGDYPLSLLPSGHQSPFPWMTPQRLTARPKTTGQIARKSREAEENGSHINNGRSKSATVRLREEPEFLRDSPSPTSLFSRDSPALLPVHRRGYSEPGMPLELKSELSMGISTMRAPGVEAGVYVKVDSLGPGQCFGLETAVKGSMPKLSLLSLGCEIIRVSMSKFREYADKATQNKAEDMFTKCPSDYTLWTSFQKQNRWNNFKNGIVTDVVYEAHQNNSLNQAGGQSGGGMVSRDNTSRASKKAVETTRQKKVDQIAYVSNPFPKISFAARAWADNTAPSGRSSTPACNTRSHSRQNSHGSRSASSRLSRVISSAYSVGSRRSGNRSISPQRAVHSRLYSIPSRPRVPHIDSITKPTYTGSMSWKQLGKS